MADDVVTHVAEPGHLDLDADLLATLPDQGFGEAFALDLAAAWGGVPIASLVPTMGEQQARLANDQCARCGSDLAQVESLPCAVPESSGARAPGDTLLNPEGSVGSAYLPKTSIDGIVSP